MLEENGIQNGHKLMSFYFFIKSIFKNLQGMLSISLKLLETFLVFLFLKQGCAQAESGAAGHSRFYRFRAMGHLQFSSVHSLVK